MKRLAIELVKAIVFPNLKLSDLSDITEIATIPVIGTNNNEISNIRVWK